MNIFRSNIEVVEIGHVKAEVCKNDVSDRLLLQLFSIYPLIFFKSKKSKVLKLVTISNKINQRKFKIGGLYWKAGKKIIINGNVFGVIKNCKIYSKNPLLYSRLSETIVHELIHYIYYTKYNKQLFRSICLHFYYYFWYKLLNPDYLNLCKDLAVTNFHIAFTIFDKNKANSFKNLNKLLKHLKKRNMLNITDQSYKVLLEISNGNIGITLDRQIEVAFEYAYTKIYGNIPSIVKYGQELVDTSEIISVSAQTPSQKTFELISRISELL